MNRDRSPFGLHKDVTALRHFAVLDRMRDGSAVQRKHFTRLVVRPHRLLGLYETRLPRVQTMARRLGLERNSRLESLISSDLAAAGADL